MSNTTKAARGEAAHVRGSSVVEAAESIPPSGINDTPNRVDQALALASLGYYVHPLHTVRDGHCSCGATDCKAGKHPNGRINPRGTTDATTDTASIIQWWALHPDNNIGISADKSDILVIGPDCPERHEDFRQRGLPKTMVVQSGSGNHHYYYRRPAGCPITKINKPGDYDILAIGNVVAPGSMALGEYVPLTPSIPVSELPEAPAWAVALLQGEEKRRQERQSIPIPTADDPPVRLSNAALEWWSGKRQARDRSGTLFAIAKELYKANATMHTIATAIAERDVALGEGWEDGPKYAGRPDATERYIETARNAIAAVMKEHSKPALAPSEVGPCPSCNQLQLQLGQAQAEARMLRDTLTRQWKVIRNPRLGSSEKIAGLAILHDVASAQHDPKRQDEQGRVITYRKRIADAAGVGVDTISRTTKKFSEWGLIQKDEVKVSRDIITEDGEIVGADVKTEWRLQLVNELPAVMDALATFEPPADTPRHGGARRPHCPDHPNAPVRVTKITQWHCSDCEKLLDRERTESSYIPAETETDSDSNTDYLVEETTTQDAYFPEEGAVCGNGSIGQQDAYFPERGTESTSTTQDAPGDDLPQRRQRKQYPGEVWNPYLQPAGGGDD